MSNNNLNAEYNIKVSEKHNIKTSEEHNIKILEKHNIKVSEETRNEIFKQIEQNYKDDIKEMIYGKKCWRRTGMTFETMSKVTLAIGSLLSFSSGYFNSNVLSFISGSISVISLALLQFGSFGFQQSKKRGNDLNVLLKKLNLDTVPIMDDDSDALTSGNNKTVADKGILNNDDMNACHSLPDTMREEKSHGDVININPKTSVSHADNINSELIQDHIPKKSINNIKIIEDGKTENIANKESMINITVT